MSWIPVKALESAALSKLEISLGESVQLGNFRTTLEARVKGIKGNEYDAFPNETLEVLKLL